MIKFKELKNGNVLYYKRDSYGMKYYFIGKNPRLEYKWVFCKTNGDLVIVDEREEQYFFDTLEGFIKYLNRMNIESFDKVISGMKKEYSEIMELKEKIK